jgi:hypothetical protein
VHRRGANSLVVVFAIFVVVALGTTAAPRALAGGPPFLVASEFNIGGSGHDRLTDLVIDAGGNAYVAGVVGSYNFPGIDSARVTNGGVDLRFVAKFAPLSRTPIFVAVVGSPTASLQDTRRAEFASDEAQGLALDNSGNAYLVAYEAAKDYPVTGGTFQATTSKKHVFKIGPLGQVSKLSIALDAAIDRVGAIAVDGAGAFYLTGSAHDGLLTTPGAPYSTSTVAAGCIAPYVMKLDPTGKTVVYATYLGSSGTAGQLCGGHVPTLGNSFLAPILHPTGFAIAVDALGNAYVTGQAQPGLAATPGALDFGTKIVGVFPGNNLSTDPALHAFVSKVNPTGTAMVFTARLGGHYLDRGTSIALDLGGAVVVGGKTSSHDFPIAASAVPGAFPGVVMDCVLWTPEVGFLAKVSPSGQQLLFSGYLPLDGDQLDDCNGSGGYRPARAAIDTSGNIYVSGYTTASNRVIDATPDAIIPDPVGVQVPIGSQLLQIYSGDGQRLLYSTTLNRDGTQGIGVDPWQNIVIAGDRSLQTIAPGLLPIDLSIGTGPICAGQPASLVARVAPGNSSGSIDFQVDGASVGTASLAGGSAVKSVPLAVGIRKIKAVHHGTGPFDGYASPDTHVAVNQAGVCQ